jgi:hypothetical protein
MYKYKWGRSELAKIAHSLPILHTPEGIGCVFAFLVNINLNSAKVLYCIVANLNIILCAKGEETFQMTILYLQINGPFANLNRFVQYKDCYHVYSYTF